MSLIYLVLSTEALAGVVPTGTLGAGVSYSGCFYENPWDSQPIRVSPTGSVGLTWRNPRSDIHLAVSSAPLLAYFCGDIPVSHLLTLEGAWLGRTGPVFWGPYIGVGVQVYLATGLLVERPIPIGSVTLSPGVRGAVAYPGVFEVQAYLRLSPRDARLK